jgi:hypothetical protein
MPVTLSLLLAILFYRQYDGCPKTILGHLMTRNQTRVFNSPPFGRNYVASWVQSLAQFYLVYLG